MSTDTTGGCLMPSWRSSRPDDEGPGVLSRVLIAWPDSKIGSRYISKEPSHIAEGAEARAILCKFDERIMELLRGELPIHAEARADIDLPFFAAVRAGACKTC